MTLSEFLDYIATATTGSLQQTQHLSSSQQEQEQEQQPHYLFDRWFFDDFPELKSDYFPPPYLEGSSYFNAIPLAMYVSLSLYIYIYL